MPSLERMDNRSESNEKMIQFEGTEPPKWADERGHFLCAWRPLVTLAKVVAAIAKHMNQRLRRCQSSWSARRQMTRRAEWPASESDGHRNWRPGSTPRRATMANRPATPICPGSYHSICRPWQRCRTRTAESSTRLCSNGCFATQPAAGVVHSMSLFTYTVPAPYLGCFGRHDASRVSTAGGCSTRELPPAC